MKIVKRIFGGIAILLILCYGFFMICIFNPDVSKAVAKFLYADKESDSGLSRTASAGADAESAGTMPEAMAGQGGETAGTERGEAGSEAAPWGGREAVDASVVSDYVAPAQSDIVIPDDVSGRNGYQPLQDEQEQIGDADAKQLREELDAGHTGDGLEFDAAFYPYYAMLNEKGRHMYRQIYANGTELYPVFAPVETVSTEELYNIISAVYNDHPELFWLETAYAGKYVADGQCVEIELKFNRTARELESARQRFDENAQQILAGAGNLSAVHEKERFVHDALIDRITYRMGAEMNQSAYSALVNGQTVCAGYSRAFQYLMRQLGVPCYYCTGFAGESHAWNIIRLDDGFYNVDATWDDTGNGRYDYYNKTDEDYAADHIRQELSVYLPSCDGQAYRTPHTEPAQESVEEPLSGTEPAAEPMTEPIPEAEPAQEPAPAQEPQTSGGGPRSLEDTGLTDVRIFTDMQSYYADCYAQMIQNGTGKYTFYNVIEGEELYREWYDRYQRDEYREAYMDNAMAQVGSSHCRIKLVAEELQGGRYLIKHDLDAR